MSKYTLNTYGWSFEAICKSLTDEQVQLIKDKMEEEGFPNSMKSVLNWMNF